MELKVSLFLFLLIFIIQENEARRFGGRISRGRSSGSRSGGWGRSSGSNSGGWGFGSKTRISETPRQSYTPDTSRPMRVTASRTYYAPTTHRPVYRTQPSAPKFEEPKKSVHFESTYSKPSSVTSKSVSNYNNYKTTPSAPRLGGSFGSYYDGKVKGESAGKVSLNTPKPYVPPSLFKPTRYPPYPSGNPQGLHPVPHNTGTSYGSSIGASKYPQASSQPAHNPYYPTNTGSSIGASKYPQASSHPAYNPYYPANTGHSYSQSGSYPSGTHSYPGSYGNQGHSYPQSGSYQSGTHSYPGSYGNQGHSYHPSAPYHQQSGSVNAGGYHPSYPSGGSSFSQPGVVYVPSAVSRSRGTGDIVKEALIYSTVNAGVNAAANRIFYPSHYSGHNYGSGYGSGGYSSGVGRDSGGGYDQTHITHNNYYYNQPPSIPQGTDNSNSFSLGTSTVLPDNLGSGSTSSVNYQGPNNQATGGNQPSWNSQSSEVNHGSGSPAAFTNGPSKNNPNNPSVNNPDINNPNLKNPNINQPNNANPSNIPPSNPPSLLISDEELTKLTEDLFSRQEFDANKYITLNLQKKVNSTNITDKLPEPLFEVEPEVNTIPTIELIRILYDNYEYNSQIKEKVTPDMVKEQNDFLEVILQTNVMSRVMKWLTDKNYIAPDSLSKKEILTRIWFTPIEGSTSAFERTFLAENYWETSIMGLQNWVYFNHAESKKDVNYMGYMDKLDLGDKGSLLKVVFKANEIVQPTALFVGTLPELEMALYTVCFYARPNALCPISLGGAKFSIFTHTYHSWGTDFLDLALPIL